MKRLLATALAGIIACTVANSEETNNAPRFVLESFNVTLPGGAEPQRVTFKLDTFTGEVWRFDGKGFSRVVIEGVSLVDGTSSYSPEVEEERQRQRVLDEMKKIIIPKIDFQGASIGDVILFLQEASVEHDPQHRGINMILDIGGPPAWDTSSKGDPIGNIKEDAGANVGTITFRARHISVWEALKIVARVSDLRFHFEDGVIMIVKSGSRGCIMEFITRVYCLRPHVVERLLAFSSATDDRGEDSVGADVFLEQFYSNSVESPEGASMRFMLPGILVVTDVAVNIEIIESTINALNEYPHSPGRFKLLPVDHAKSEARAVLLFDKESGNTWRFTSQGKFLIVEERSSESSL